MTKLFLGLVSIFLFLQAKSQELYNLTGNNKVTTVAYWSKGDVRSYHVVRYSTEFENDKKSPVSESTMEYDLKFKVLEEKDSSYLIELVSYNYKFQDEDKDNKIYQAFDQMSSGMKIRYCTDEMGTFDSIVNKKELAEKLKEQIKVIQGTFEPEFEKDDDIQTLNMLIEFYNKVIDDPNGIESFYAEDILRTSGYYGEEMIVAKPQEIEFTYSGLNNFEFEGKATLTLNEVNKQNKTFTFIATEKPNQEEIRTYWTEIYNFMILGYDQEKMNISQFNFDTNTKHRFTLDLSSGWLLKSSHTTTTKYQLGKDKYKEVEKIAVTEK